MSKVLQRLSLRSQSPAHSSPASYISGMKYKYSPMRERSTGELKGGGYRAAAFYPCQFGEYVTLVLLFSHFSITNTHTISCENISPSPNVLGLVRQQDSPQQEADQRSLHSVLQSDFLKSTGCRSPVKAAPLHKNKHTARQSEGQQYNRSFLPVQTEPPTLNSSQRHECLLYHFHRSKPLKIQGQERKGDSGVTVQWQGCWKDGEVTRRTFTTLRG